MEPLPSWKKARPLSELKKRAFDLVVATSRYGVAFREVRDELAKRWNEAGRILIGFGAPGEGLYEIVAREHLKLGEVVDFVVDMVPGQGVETVRSEEAVFVCLGLLNCL